MTKNMKEKTMNWIQIGIGDIHAKGPFVVTRERAISEDNNA